MEERPELTLDLAIRPSDLYDPFLWSWQNVARWVLVLFAGYLIYETRPIWSSATADAGVRDALVALSFYGLLVFLMLFLFPYLGCMRRSANIPSGSGRFGFRSARRVSTLKPERRPAITNGPTLRASPKRQRFLCSSPGANPCFGFRSDACPRQEILSKYAR